jgi:hypothetical protein
LWLIHTIFNNNNNNIQRQFGKEWQPQTLPNDNDNHHTNTDPFQKYFLISPTQREFPDTDT